jgi:tRNA-specific 2-thiouridylase
VVAGGTAERAYVVDVDVAGAVVTIGPRSDLLVRTASLEALAWVDQPIAGPDRRDVLVQVSAHGLPRTATVDGSGLVAWTEPQPRVAPGQAVVLYDLTDTYVLGGGVAMAGPPTG